MTERAPTRLRMATPMLACLKMTCSMAKALWIWFPAATNILASMKMTFFRGRARIFMPMATNMLGRIMRVRSTGGAPKHSLTGMFTLVRLRTTGLRGRAFILMPMGTYIPVRLKKTSKPGRARKPGGQAASFLAINMSVCSKETRRTDRAHTPMPMAVSTLAPSKMARRLVKV